MGLLAKAVTKSRTKDVVVPVAITGPWEGDASHVAAAIVRGAACSLRVEHLMSSSFRGRDTLGIGSALRSAASSVWVERLSPRKWSISLGLATASYRRALDWQGTFEVVDGPEGRVVRASTPAVATRDGSLVHSSEFLEMRDLVLTGFRSGQVPSPQAEVAVTRTSMGGPVPAIVPLRDGADAERRVIETTRTLEGVNDVLEHLPCRILDRSSADRTLDLGPGPGPSAARLDIAVAERGAVREVSLRVEIPEGAPAITRATAARRASFLMGYVQAALASDDAVDESETGDEVHGGRGNTSGVSLPLLRHFNASESVLGPLSVGLHRCDNVRARVDAALAAAKSTVPTTLPTLRVHFQGQRKAQDVVHRRTVLAGTTAEGDKAFRLCDSRDGEKPSSAWDHWRWQLDARVVDNESRDPAFRDIETLVLFEVPRFILTVGRIDSAAQLAIFRHFAVQGLRGVDAECVVTGGQRDWDERWWPSPQA